MEEKNIKVKKALNPITLTITVLIIVSVVLNVYQFNSNNSLKNDLHTLEIATENLQNESNTLDNELETKREEMTALSSQLEELKTTVSSLETDNESLLENLEELKTTKENLEADNSDTDLTDREFFDSIWERLEKENPELFADGGGSNTYQEGNYEHVGTPSTGELPTYTLGESGSSGIAPGIIY